MSQPQFPHMLAACLTAEANSSLLISPFSHDAAGIEINYQPEETDLSAIDFNSSTIFPPFKSSLELFDIVS